jgi:protein involved in polysaccharide export with SLBB domain
MNFTIQPNTVIQQNSKIISATSYSLKKFIFLSLLALILSTFSELFAQIPSDLSKMKSSQITDAQLMQFVQQAQSSGMSESELMQQFQQRGLSEPELQSLSTRIKGLMGSGNNVTAVQDGAATTTNNKRVYKGEMTEFKMPQNPSRVFGSELFSGVDPVFVPNLKIATPKNYIIGPEDELQLDVYGNNISNQKLMVSPDGFINVKYTGPVNVSGMTIEQAAGVLKGRLTKYFPELSTGGGTKLQLTLGSIRSIKVTVVGAVKKPGTLTLPSIATLFNALYSSGGPLENGSFRNIELVRNSKTIAVADLYDFILKGDQSSNISLHDNDVILVPFAKTQIVLEGEVNRKGIFEVKSNETIKEVLDYSGGFKGGAFKGRITGTRYTDVGRSVIDVAKADFESYKLMHGDSLYVETVLSKYDNRVFISGAVFKPGAYSLEKGMDVKSLIQKAQGLKEEAFTGVANMVRLKEDYTKEYLTLDLRDILAGKSVIQLRKEDSLHIESVLDLNATTFVNINGPVKNPGDFRYEDSLSLKGLILKAGGLLENATTLRIEVGRRKADIAMGVRGTATSEIISIDIDKSLTDKGNEIILKPFDVISIKKDPSKVKQVTVEVKGEVVFAGSYTLENPEEKLSSIIKRAGGILPYADIYGAKLVRKRLLQDNAFIKRLTLSNVNLNYIDREKTDTSKLIEMDQLNSKTTDVALELDKILARPGSDVDVILHDEDQIIIPRFVNTVAVSGEVLKPVTVQYQPGNSFRSYISAGGGFNRNASRKRVFVVYSNGRSSSTRSFLGIKTFPKVTPGSSIFVPMETVRQSGFDPAKAGVLVSAFASIMTILVLLFK